MFKLFERFFPRPKPDLHPVKIAPLPVLTDIITLRGKPVAVGMKPPARTVELPTGTDFSSLL